MQVHYWQDSVTLWAHAVKVTTPPSASIYHALGDAYDEKGQIDQAVLCYTQAVDLNPLYLPPYFRLALDLEKQGHLPDAARYLEKVLGLDPEERTLGMSRGPPGTVHFHLGLILAAQGQLPKAVAWLEAGAKLNPDLPEIPFLLGQLQLKQGRAEEAIAPLERAVDLHPGNARYRCYLALALQSQGDIAAAAEQYAEALRLSPDWPAAVNRQAWALATNPNPRMRSGADALQLALQVCQATGYRQPEYLDTLAAAYAEAGNFGEAVATARKALALTSPDRAEPLRCRLRLYESRQAFHED